MNTSQTFRLLTLNLHCYQEDDQLNKFGLIADEIARQNIEVVCFQEAAQNRNSTSVKQNLKEDNAAYVIQQILLNKFGLDYQLEWDWSHYGWQEWEEGLAILSKYPIRNFESKYVTNSTSKSDWKSRIAVYADIEVNEELMVPITNTHLGWLGDEEEPYESQLKKLRSFQGTNPGILAGDFNLAAGTAGYQLLLKPDTVDCYLLANPAGMLDATIGGQIDGWESGDPEGMRIDYVWLDTASPFKVIDAKILFKEKDIWPVSDHAGVLVEFSSV